MTYTQFSGISHTDIYDFCMPYSLIVFDEAHHTGAKGYLPNIERIIDYPNRSARIFGITTHTKRYSDDAEDVACSVFEGHKINGISFEDAIKKQLLPQFDYISALYSMPKDIDDLVASSSLARGIISDSRLVQVNEEGIKQIIKKHMPTGYRKVVYFVPSIEDCEDAEKLAKEMGYGHVYAINYTKPDKENKDSLKAYNEAKEASLVCISKFNEGAIPEGTNSVVILRRTTTINIFERQVLTALWSAKDRPVVYDFVLNIDSLIYSRKGSDESGRSYYAERVKSLCSQSIVVDYARQWISVFDKIRSISQNGWTPMQDELLKKYYPKYGNNIYKYIKGHNLKECIARAEVLGVKYIEPEKVKVVEKKIEAPYRFTLKNIGEKDIEKMSANMVNIVCRAYQNTLNTGKNPTSMISKLKTGNKTLVKNLLILTDICINCTTITDEGRRDEIEQRQALFKRYIESYASSYNKKTSTAVILDGKAVLSEVSQKDIARHVQEAKLEKKKDSMVLLGDHYMSKKQAVAGQYGETVMEHTLHKTYVKFLLGGYDKKKTIITPFLKEFSLKDVEEKITSLRESTNPWSKESINFIRTSGNNPEKLYKSLLVEHSDLDILKMAQEVGNESFLDCCMAKKVFFEKNYATFLADYKAAEDEAEAKKERAMIQKQREEENRKKKELDKQRLKNLKPTVVMVSKKKK